MSESSISDEMFICDSENLNIVIFQAKLNRLEAVHALFFYFYPTLKHITDQCIEQEPRLVSYKDDLLGESYLVFKHLLNTHSKVEMLIFTDYVYEFFKSELIEQTKYLYDIWDSNLVEQINKQEKTYGIY